MSMAKVSTYRAHDTINAKGATQLERGQNSFDNVIVQSVGKEPFLSFARSGDNPIHWVQLLHALEHQGAVKNAAKPNCKAEGTDRQEQCNASTSERHGVTESGNIPKGFRVSTRAANSSSEHSHSLKIPEAVIAFAQAAAKANDLPGWPLMMSPTKIQLQKCDRCSREFCSQINYRRHIRVHRRSLNSDKVFPRNRELLAEFWDKLSLNEAKELASLEDFTFEDISGSSLLMALGSLMRKSGYSSLPYTYMKAGVTLYDIAEGRRSPALPISSQDLFAVLDDASEKTFLCAGTGIALHKFVFESEAAKVALETRNLIACTSFLLEQKLVKAWLADKDAEALRWQKLLFEEEEAAQRRQAELLVRKRMKKLRQKEQKVKENVIMDEQGPEVCDDVVQEASALPRVEASSDAAVEEIHLPEDGEDDREQPAPSFHPVLKSPRNGFGAFHPPPHLNRGASMHRTGGYRDPKATAHFTCQQVWARKSKPSCEEKERIRDDAVKESIKDEEEKERIGDGKVKESVRGEEAVAVDDCKVLIGSISVTLKESPSAPPADHRQLFSSQVAAAFLSQRWRDALSSERASFVLSTEADDPPLEDQVVNPEMGYRQKKSYTLKYIPKKILTG